MKAFSEVLKPTNHLPPFLSEAENIFIPFISAWTRSVCRALQSICFQCTLTFCQSYVMRERPPIGMNNMTMKEGEQ